MTPEELWEVRARINEYHPGELRDWLLKSLDALEEAWTERDRLRNALLGQGCVPCDIPACNCGSWHAKYGYPERMEEMGELLAEAGHPRSNENWNLLSNALRALIQERDDAIKDGLVQAVRIDELMSTVRVLTDRLTELKTARAELERRLSEMQEFGL